MLKVDAIEQLGGSISAAADAIGVSYEAVHKWPDVLPARIADRVQAALWRKANGMPPPTRVSEDAASDQPDDTISKLDARAV